MAVTLSLTRKADLKHLEEMRGVIEDGCKRSGVSEETTYGLKLAVDEVCTNIILHGYEGMEPGKIKLRFYASSKRIQITVTDSGRAFNPQNAPEPDLDSHWNDRRIGGLGVYFLKHIADEITYESAPGKTNQLTIIKWMGD